MEAANKKVLKYKINKKYPKTKIIKLIKFYQHHKFKEKYPKTKIIKHIILSTP